MTAVYRMTLTFADLLLRDPLAEVGMMPRSSIATVGGSIAK